MKYFLFFVLFLVVVRCSWFMLVCVNDCVTEHGQAWVGHPYYDVIDNSTDFKHKVVRMIAVSGITY